MAGRVSFSASAPVPDPMPAGKHAHRHDRGFHSTVTYDKIEINI